MVPPCVSYFIDSPWFHEKHEVCTEKCWLYAGCHSQRDLQLFLTCALKHCSRCCKLLSFLAYGKKLLACAGSLCGRHKIRIDRVSGFKVIMKIAISTGDPLDRLEYSADNPTLSLFYMC